ncbi:hypothetical protein BSKO_10934 [Bryopsis sp. KO-2023]|nr:hypothetical protein BSKO_10934 [Bryopsis sp. KO-2023]
MKAPSVSFGDLPGDMIVEILDALTAREIAKCSCLSKDWKTASGVALLRAKIRVERAWRVGEVDPLDVNFEGGFYINCAAKHDSVVVVGGLNGIELWNLDTKCRSLFHHPDSVHSLCFNGDLLLSGHLSGHICGWGLTRTSSRLFRFEAHTTCVLTLLDLGEVLASGAKKGDIKIWRKRDWVCESILAEHTGHVSCLASADDGRLLISGSEDSTLRVWRLSTKRCLRELQGHSAAVSCVVVHDNTIASGSRDCTIRLWNLHNGVCVRVLDGLGGAVGSIVLSGGKIIGGVEAGAVHVWDVEKGCSLRRFRVYCLQSGVWVDNDAKLTVASRHGHAFEWDFRK